MKGNYSAGKNNKIIYDDVIFGVFLQLFLYEREVLVVVVWERSTTFSLYGREVPVLVLWEKSVSCSFAFTVSNING